MAEACLPRGDVAFAVGRTLLVSQDRLPRRPLDAWAADMLGELRSVETLRTVGDRTKGIAMVANQAALIAVHHGMFVIARSLCLRQMRWVERVGRRGGDAEASAMAIQPWINLARLDARTGATDRALGQFARLADLARAVHLNRPHDVPSRDPCGRWVATAAVFWRLAAVVSISDPLQIMLQARRWTDTLAFIDRCHPACIAEAGAFVEDAQIVALAASGDTAQALSVAIRAAARYRSLVFRIRIAEVLAASGDRDGARAALKRLLPSVPRLFTRVRGTVDHLLLVLRLAECWRELDDHDHAYRLAERTYDEARAHADELLQFATLDLLLDVAPADLIPAWRVRRAALTRATHYVRYRASGAPDRSSRAITELYERVHDALE